MCVIRKDMHTNVVLAGGMSEFYTVGARDQHRDHYLSALKNVRLSISRYDEEEASEWVESFGSVLVQLELGTVGAISHTLLDNRSHQ